MKNRCLSFLIFLSICAFTKFDGGQSAFFPDMGCETLNGRKINLPTDIKGKFSIIAVAYSQDAEKSLKTWLEPIYDKYIAQTELMGYDINLYFIPMFTGAKAASADFAKSKIKSETDATLQPHILIYKGELERYKTALKLDKKEVPYIFVLDKDGKIVHVTSGTYTDNKLEEIDDKLD